MLPILFTAFLGGSTRAALGIHKYNLKHGQLSAIVIDGIIGAICGAAFMSTVNVAGNVALFAAGLAGYVGADVIESLHKIHLKRGALWV